MAKVQRSAARRASPSAQFLPLKGGRKSDQVFEQISAFIGSGRFVNGSRLPAERELTAMFNTSRQTIREAIYRAELVGLSRYATARAASSSHASRKFEWSAALPT